ncbi:MAG: hypothetical protein LH624_16555, partial [Cryobacterium sp.]|nr:hypothetical protein [Cryobacterium sp.]
CWWGRSGWWSIACRSPGGAGSRRPTTTATGPGRATGGPRIPPSTSPALVAVAPAASGPAAGMAGELVADVLAELPPFAGLTAPDRLLAAAWLASLRSARTRRSYAGDLLGWQGWAPAEHRADL